MTTRASQFHYDPRIVDAELADALQDLAAVAIEGPKAVGKTYTALRAAKTVYRLDEPEGLAAAQADPRRLVTGAAPILIDEWQRLPESWDRVRRAVDGPPPAAPGSFILTGSAYPLDQPAHTGAGRIASIRMRPLALAERSLATPSVSMRQLLERNRPAVSGATSVTLDNYVDEIMGSGFPAIRRLSAKGRRKQLDAYLTRIVDREFDELGRTVRRPQLLRRWLAAYAASTATTTSFEKIREAASGGKHEQPPARPTAIAYREILERIYILDAVNAWEPGSSHVGRLSASPKHHLADPAFAVRLLRVSRDALIAGGSAGPSIPRDGTLLGALFESLVTQSVRVYAQANGALTEHFRTWEGTHEADLIVRTEDDHVLAIEVKLAPQPDDKAIRHLHWLQRELGTRLADAVVITTGAIAYRRPDGIGVIPAALLGP